MRNPTSIIAWALALLLVAAGSAAGKPLDIRISGLDEPLIDNVRLYLSLADFRGGEVQGQAAADEASGEGDKDDTEVKLTEPELRRLHAGATEEIIAALKPFGYYRAKVDADLTEEPESWLARYAVEPGPPTRLGTVNIDVFGDGRDAPEIERVLDAIRLDGGEPLVHSEFESAKTLLYETAYDAGYIGAEWRSSEVRVGADKALADVDLVLDTGSRFYFGEVEFEQDVLDAELLQRFVQFEPGEPYHTSRLLDLQLALNDSRYFERVEVLPQRDRAGDDRRIPVTVATTVNAPHTYTVGVGVATDTGPRVKLAAELRRINRAGHRIRADLRLSAIENALAARYEIPIANVVTDTLAFTGTVKQEDIGDAETDQFQLGVSRNESWMGFRRTLYLNVQRENFQFGEAGTERQSDLLYPGITLARQRADDLQYPRRGYSLTFDLRGATTDVLSDATFLRLDVEARWVRALTDSTRVLVLGKAGTIETSSFDALPPSQRFFTGGDRSVRGYGYQDIGARNADNANIGGSNLIAGSVEFEYLFAGDYGAALFVDAGDAYIDDFELQTGIGLGFRWRSPIGMVRADVAHPLDDPNDSYRLHLSIGPDL